MECPRCAGESWLKLYSIRRPAKNEIERKLICSNCHLIVITKEQTKQGLITNPTVNSRMGTTANIRYRRGLDGERIKTIERIRFVIVYNPNLNQAMQIEYNLYKWDLDEYYKNRLKASEPNAD